MNPPREVSLDELGSWLDASPFHRLLGITLVRAEAGRVTVALPYRSELLADVSAPYIHGGVIATLADIAACFAMISRVGHDVPTLDLRIDYLRPAPPESLEATGTVIKAGRSVGVADAEVRDQRAEVIAVARGLFSTRT